MPCKVPCDREQKKNSRVHSCCSGGVGIPQVICHQHCGKGIQGNGEEQKAVEKQEPSIDPSDKVEHVVVIHPHDQYGQETREKGKKGRPFKEQTLCKVAVFAGGLRRVSKS